LTALLTPNEWYSRTILKTTHQFVMTDEYMAEAQRLCIAQNKTLKFLYQTWWAWWLPRVVIVGLMIFLSDQPRIYCSVGIVLVLSFTGEWFGLRNLAKARKKVRAKGLLDENVKDSSDNNR
jgi:hypothetical protein